MKTLFWSQKVNEKISDDRMTHVISKTQTEEKDDDVKNCSRACARMSKQAREKERERENVCESLHSNRVQRGRERKVGNCVRTDTTKHIAIGR